MSEMRLSLFGPAPRAELIDGKATNHLDLRRKTRGNERQGPGITSTTESMTEDIGKTKPFVWEHRLVEVVGLLKA